MLHVTCYSCGSAESTLYTRENGFDLVRCGQCGLLYVNPRPTDAEITEAARTGLHRGAQTFDRIGQFDPRKVKKYGTVLRRVCAGLELGDRRWLDIGCGHGEFLEALRRYADGSIDAVGIEPSTKKREAAQGRGLAVHDESFTPAAETLGGISLLNVYSHLPNPVEALAGWRRWLRPGGYFLIQTGDSAHLPLEYHHKPFDLPDHLSFTNEPLLRSLLEKTGFRVERCVKFRHRKYHAWEFWKHPRRDMWMLATRV